MRTPLLFLVVAVLPTLLTIYFVFDIAPSNMSVTDMVGVGLYASVVFILVALVTAIAAVWMRNAPMDGAIVFLLTTTLILGSCVMLGLLASGG